MKKLSPYAKDLRGQKFGRLTVIEFSGIDKTHVIWRVRCDCGNEKNVISSNLKISGGTKSCGCLAKEILRERSITHGMTNHPVYKVWKMMRDRCQRPSNISYKYYGARGIKVCKRWTSSFEVFFKDMGESYKPGLTLDRKNNNKNYSKKNCRWVTPRVQSNNRRTNRIIKTPEGLMTLAQAARHYNIGQATLHHRLKHHHYPIEKFFRPTRKWGRAWNRTRAEVDD